MTDEIETLHWYSKKPLLIAWLLVFFPVGLYGLWKGPHFDKNWKIGITVAVVVLFALTGFRLINPLMAFVLFPIALYLLWTATDVAPNITYRFAGAWVVVALLTLVNLAAPAPGSGPVQGGYCAAVITEGNCTYYRDDDCNVIGRQCS